MEGWQKAVAFLLKALRALAASLDYTGETRAALERLARKFALGALQALQGAA